MIEIKVKETGKEKLKKTGKKAKEVYTVHVKPKMKVVIASAAILAFFVSLLLKSRNK